MSTPRLRLERVAKRKSNFFNEEGVGTSVMREAVTSMREHNDRMNGHANGFETNLCELFNVRFVEFVRYDGRRYIPVLFEKKATHKLTPTAWNKEPGKNFMPKDWATSVCAVPVRPKIRATGIKLRKTIPKDGPTYRMDGRVEGKQSVLRWIVVATKAKVPLKALPKMSGDECDQLYLAIARASRRRKLRKLLEG